MKPRSSALSAKTYEVKAHTRAVPPSVLFNETSLKLMRETGFVPGLVMAVLPKPRQRVKAGRKVQ